MDYKKKYEDALERARVWKEKSGMPIDRQGILDDIFPELKESEDERISKDIIAYMQYERKSTKEEIENRFIPWLEKQGKQETNEIHPIFRVGDYIKNKNTSDKVVIEQLNVESEVYYYTSYDGAAEIHSDFPFSKQDEWELIGQKIVEQKSAWSGKDSCCYDDICEILINLINSPKSNVNKDVVQRDLNWIMSISNRIKSQAKSAWSEEDENMLQKALSTIRYALSIPADKEDDPCFAGSSTIDWLKSLKERMKGE